MLDRYPYLDRSYKFYDLTRPLLLQYYNPRLLLRLLNRDHKLRDLVLFQSLIFYFDYLNLQLVEP